MAKVNFKEVEMLQMNGSYQVVDIREKACEPFYWHKEEKMVMLGQRLYQGECELTDDEVAIIRKLAEPWPWITRNAIERQLCAE